MMMHNSTFWEGPVRRLPIHDGAQPPAVRLRHFDPCSRGTVLIVSEGDRADGQFVLRNTALFELGFRRKMQALGVRFAPRFDARPEASIATASFGLGLSILCRATLRATLSPAFMRRLVSEYLTTPFARFLHGYSVAVAGLGTVPKHTMPTLFDVTGDAA